jgi:Glycosyl transferases group 1
VVVNREPYKHDITGEVALDYNTPSEFADRLSAMLEHPKWRTDLARNARTWVLAHRDAGKSAHLWTDAYGSLLA